MWMTPDRSGWLGITGAAFPLSPGGFLSEADAPGDRPGTWYGVDEPVSIQEITTQELRTMDGQEGLIIHVN